MRPFQRLQAPSVRSWPRPWGSAPEPEAVAIAWQATEELDRRALHHRAEAVGVTDRAQGRAEPLLALLDNLQLTLVLGLYARDYHLGDHRRTLTDTVRAWRDRWPEVVPLPHPSPRNNRWLKQNPWFEAELVPALRERVSGVLIG